MRLKLKIKKGDRVSFKGKAGPGRGVVFERIDNVCLCYRDDSQYPVLVHVKDMDIIK